MTILDISWPLSGQMTPYRERKLFQAVFWRSWENDNTRQSSATIDSHAGTHIDAPAHYQREGKTIDQVSLDTFVGPCRVLDLSEVEERITAEVLQSQGIQDDERILLKTRNSQYSPTAPFLEHFVYLEKSGAAYLAAKKLKLVGIDYLGLERNQPNHESHQELLRQDVCVVEGLRLGHVPAGRYHLACLPLSYQGLEAAPARAILML